MITELHFRFDCAGSTRKSGDRGFMNTVGRGSEPKQELVPGHGVQSDPGNHVLGWGHGRSSRSKIREVNYLWIRFWEVNYP